MSTFARSTKHGFYGYTPTAWVCIIFLALFGVSTVAHVGQSVRYRLWWLLPTAATAGVGEIIGWTGRYWSSRNVEEKRPFLIQISTTIMSPTFLIASYFIIFGQIIQRLGTQYSRLQPRLYAIVFLTADTVALIIQAVGGAQASAADTLAGANKGAKVMLAGIIIQLLTISIFSVLVTEFVIRHRLNNPLRQALEKPQPGLLDHRIMLMLVGTYFSMLVLVIRSVYRTIELADGWNGRIISNELFFNVLDGAMIVLAIFSLNIFHPGVLLGNPLSPPQ